MNSQEPKHGPGDQVGPFTLEMLLGQGASAEVWLVNERGELGFTKRQALKLLRPPPGDIEGQKKALINEARVCGRLKHRSLVDVYRVGEHEGELYIAMEFVDGPDLNTLLSALRRRSVPVPVCAAIEAAVELAEALEHAHTRTDDDGVLLGIVHRDLKPSNVLVERDGVLKISDWGLVKSSLNVESTTRGVVKGTPGYIAPEVWGGTRDFKPAADLFALGAMLYEMVVGERLFRGKNLARIAEQVARRKPEEEAARVRERCPELEAPLTRMLQRSPQRRYQTAAEVGAALRPLLDRLPAEEGLKPFLQSIRSLIEEYAPRRITSSTGSGIPPVSVPPPAPALPSEDSIEEVAPPAPKVPNLAAPAGEAQAEEPAANTRSRDNAGPAPDTDSQPVAAPDSSEGPAKPGTAPAPPADGDTLPEGERRPVGLEIQPTRLVPPEKRLEEAADGPKGAAGTRQRRARRGGPPKKTGPSTALGLFVAVVGLFLLSVGLVAYFVFLP